LYIRGDWVTLAATMPYTGWLWQFLNWMSLPILAVVAGILVWRTLHREFPLFFWFLLVTEGVGVLRFVAQFGTSRTYARVYWISDLAIMIFNFLAVYELFVSRLFPRFYRIKVYRFLFAAAASSVIFVGWLTALQSSSGTSVLLVEGRVLDFVVVAMLAFLVALMLLMGREWKKYDFGIAFGFAINAAASLITSATWVRTRYQPTSIDQLPLIAFDVSCLIWLVTFWRPQKRVEFPPAEQLDREMLHQARTWETLLKDWLTPGKSKR
jgi:hypothetical protein